jgi:hypothetical protein
MRVAFKIGVIGWEFSWGTRRARSTRVVLHRIGNCEQNSGGNALGHDILFAYDYDQKSKP